MDTRMLEERRDIKFTNVAFHRVKVMPSEMGTEIVKFINHLESQAYEKNGPIITATLGVEQQNAGQLIDLGIYIPIIGGEELQYPYKIIEEFELINIVYFRFQGHPSQYQQSLMDVLGKLSQHSIQSGAIYNAHINSAAFLGGDELILDTYVQAMDSQQ